MATSKQAPIEWPPLLIVARYTVKREHGKFPRGCIVYLVENSEGKRYQVTLRRSGASCSCSSHRRCYHIDQCIELHNKRVAARRRQAQEMEEILQEAESLAS